MSTSFHDFTGKADPLGHALVESVFGIDKAAKANKDAEAAGKAQASQRESEDATAAARLKTKQVGTRRENLMASASAAGATRSGNESDLLPGMNRTKRKGAVRELLGE